MMQTEAWRSLTPAERAVYVEVRALFDGRNNGSLTLSNRDAADRCNINKDTAGRAFGRLTQLGFLEVVEKGWFNRKTPHATTWRLTDLRCDLTGAVPSKAYQGWRPGPEEKTRSEMRVAAVPSFRTVAATGTGRGPLVSDSDNTMGQAGNMNGPLVSDTYTSSHRQGVADGVASAPPQGAVASEPGSGTTAHDKITTKISRSDRLEPSA